MSIYINPAIILSFFCMLFGSKNDVDQSAKLKTYEIHALKKNVAGKTYYYNLTGSMNCNKTQIKYLGEIQTKNGRRFRIVTSVFVHKKNTECATGSFIRIYDGGNRYIGEYNVDLPQDLPDTLIEKKLVYRDNSANCSRRKGYALDFGNGLPKSIYIPCTKEMGDLYHFNRTK